MSLIIDCSNKTVVVVGGTNGINRGIAEQFAAHGANVAVASRSQDKVDDTVASLKSIGTGAAMGFSVDVRDAEGVQTGLKTVHQTFGDFDVLISGAAGNFPAMARSMSPNAFKSVIDIDLMGTFHVMNAAYPYLRKPGASVINISAPQAFLPLEAQSHVCAAKAGVDMITRTLSLEWGPEGIRINSIVPGPIDETEGLERLAPTPELREMTIQSVPLKRIGYKSDIANVCMFLGSELSSYISGVVLPVDGAWSLGGCGGMGNFLSKFARAQEPNN